MTSVPRVPSDLIAALQDRHFAEAIKLIDGELEKPQIASADYLLYLRGRAQTELKLYDQAIETFRRLERAHPKSPWASRARFGHAEVFIRQRNYQRAGEIYEREATRLLSAGRRDELAAIYLEFADRFFDGFASESNPGAKEHDYERAEQFYLQARTLHPSLEKLQRIDLRIARCREERHDPSAAANAFRKFIADYGVDTDAKKRAPVALEIEARFRLGRALLAVGQPAEARKTWEDLLAGAAFRLTGDDFLAQAQFQLSRTYGVPNPQSDGDLELGVAALETFLKGYPKHRLAPTAELDIAMSSGSRGRFEPAVARLKSLIANSAYASSEELPKARNLLGEILFSQKKFDAAIAVWRAFLAAHPNHKAWKDVLNRVTDAEFQKGLEAFQRKNFAAARELWDDFLKKHPVDERAASILYQFGQMKYLEGVDRVNERIAQAAKTGQAIEPVDSAARQLFEEAIEVWKRVVAKYGDAAGGTPQRAALMIGVVLEERLGRLEDAIKAYNKVESDEAARRLARLTERQMQVLTPRKFRAKERPVLRLSTRNVERVTVKVYRVEMTDYFRKMHLAGGIEALDVSLIDPDKTFDYAVTRFEPLRPFENDVELPVSGPGVWAVTVSSDKLEATTMVVVSDIDVIVKCSRNELFVFAEDVAARKPAAGTRLLISDGSRIFAEETTDNEGIVQKTYDELKTVKDLRVFAVRDGHVASTVSPLEGLDFAVGLSPVGQIDTDRPAYRAGELVNLRGIIRWVAGDWFTFKEGEKYQLEVADPRGRALHTAEVKLGRFGTFATSFVLPDSVPQGKCSIRVFQTTGQQSYTAQFEVHEAKLEPIRLEVDLPRKVYYRGEKVAGKIRLRYYYGTPLAGREIQYRLADDRIQTGTTNAAGELTFELPTRRYSESQTLELSVLYAEHNVRAVERIFLAARALDVRISTVRKVYLSGETFDATVVVTDPAGQPVATDLKLDVLEQMTPESMKSAGKSGERLIESFEIKTDKDKGTGRRTVHIDKSGKYVLRATAVDRFGTPVSGSHDLVISGEDDEVRLRILADRHTYQSGDAAQVKIHWRQAPALALVSFEGASILGHRLVELKTGPNTFDFPVESQLAPNFVLSVAVIDETQLHRASSDFAVTRKLRITLAPSHAAPKPGEKLSVDITATDPQGRPVAAEISLAMVERKLFDLFGGKNVALDEVFGRGERKPSIRTMASCTFLYHPTTRGISEALLAEQDRERAAGAEAHARGSLESLFDSDGIPRPGLADASREDARKERTNQRLLADYSLLLRAGRYAEAELVARRAKELDPQNSLADLLFERARITRQAMKSKDFKSQSFSSALYDPSDAAALADDLEETVSESSWDAIQARIGDSSGMVGAMGGMGRGMGGHGEDTEKAKTIRRPSGVSHTNRSNGKRHLSGAREFKLNLESAKKWPRGTIVGMNSPTEKSQSSELGLGRFGAPNSPAYATTPDSSPALNGFSLQPMNQFGPVWFFNGYVQNSKGETFAYQTTSDGRSPIAPQVDGRFFGEKMLGETGYWNPAIVTGADGKATVTFRLPERSTAWKLRAAGIDSESLAGDADSELVAKKEFFGELKLPTVFTAGDRADVLVDIQNTSVERGAPIDVRFKITLGERTTELKKSLVSSGPGIQSVVFPATFGEPGTAEFELTVASGERRDVVRRSVPVRAYGLPVSFTASGTAGQSTIAFVDFDRRLSPQNPQLEIVIGPSVDRTLLDAVLGGGGGASESLAPCASLHLTNPLERATSDVLGGVALLALVRASRNADTPEATALAVRIRAAIAQLLAAQRADGAWSWSGGTSGNADPYLSSRAAWALAVARRAGFAVAPAAFDSATAYLSTALAAAHPSHRDAQAALFHALSECGKGDFAIGNRLYRERNRLSSSGLLHVALALGRLDRKEMAGELLSLVRVDLDAKTAAGDLDDSALSQSAPVARSGVELRALYLLALVEIAPASEKGGKVAEWLLAARRGSRWTPDRANGPAVAALARWFGAVKQIREKYTLTVYVNDHLLQMLTVDPSVDPSRRLEVPGKMLVQGRAQRINFDLEGRERFSYSAVLSGFVPAERLASTTDEWFVERWYEPAQQMLDGELIPRGFDVLTGSYTTFRNNLAELPVGSRGEVTLNLWRRNVRGTPDEQLDYLVITEPLPAGTAVLPDSVHGNFERYEISAGAITFYVGAVPYPGMLTYTLVGYAPGNFRTAPTVVRSFYQPQRMVFAHPKTLDVLPRGAVSRDVYRLTPRELFEFGKRLVAKGQYAAGAEHLAKLVKQHRLRDDIYREAVQSLFRAALALGHDQSIVENFEIIKEKLPDVEVDFESILRVALAYRALGEYERSFLVYRATIEALFQRESQIAGFLDEHGQFLRSVAVMERLLREFPAEAYVATATYSLAQEIDGKADAAAGNDELRRAGLTRVDLIAASIEILDYVVAAWPDDPAADRATFSTVSAFLDLEKYESAIRRSRRAVERYPASPLADSFWYAIGYSQYELGKSEEALATCRKVAEMTRKDPETGRIEPAQNKWEAVYISGQIFHSLGKPAQALAEYERVKEKFADAKEAIDFFVHRKLTLPEVVTVRPAAAGVRPGGRPGDGGQIALTYRNIPRVDLKVYRVDLLKFGLLQRNLAKITAINLAGIRPYHEESVALGDGKDYRDREKLLFLPLKDEGAYLLVCRSGDDYASGLVLVSPLELTVQEDATSGRVRVTAKDAVADRYVAKVLVKVIGSQNSDFQSGETDLRGIFKADAIRGTSTVIARAEKSRYAFFRGTTPLGPPAVPANRSEMQQESPAQRPAPAPKAAAPLLENLQRSNSGIQQQQRDSYRSLLRNRKQGVKAQDAF